MPVKKSNKIDLENLELPQVVNNTRDFQKSIKYEKKEKIGVLPTLSINSKLIEKFRSEAKEKRWTLTTLMTEILSQRYGENENENN